MLETLQRMEPTITVTGADERTSLDELLRLTRLSPRIEIGLLYSESPKARNRHPSKEWLGEAIAALRTRCAVHICGFQARERALCGAVAALNAAGRVQVNGVVTPDELLAAAGLCRVVITQHDEKNSCLAALDVAGHSLLVDASGGRGISPARWERPDTQKPVGFAGGLGPDNLAAELPRIAAVARAPWWVDMEGKLRTPDDWFSVDLTERALSTFLNTCFDRRHLHEPGQLSMD